MLRTQAIVGTALVALLFAAGTVSAADRDASPRQPVRGQTEIRAQLVQPAGPASAAQILRLRFLETIRLLKVLRQAESAPTSFGTDGLSDGPDPIDQAEQGPNGAGVPRKQADTTGGPPPPDSEAPEPNNALGL